MRNSCRLFVHAHNTISACIIALGFLQGCSKDAANSNPNGPRQERSFDREALLTHLADQLILPAYADFTTQVNKLQLASETFANQTDQSNLDKLRNAWKKAYIAWQWVAMYEIGQAETISYLNFINVFPTNTEEIEKNISTGVTDLSRVSSQDEQGFAALDYLLYGVANSDDDILTKYTQPKTGVLYTDYLQRVTNRIAALTQSVISDWETRYRSVFINDSSSSASSSLDKLINDYIYYLEKHLRAGKIGIPIGMFSNGKTLENTFEGLYAKKLSNVLFQSSLQSIQNFYNGIPFGGGMPGPSIRSYIEQLDINGQGALLNQDVNANFDQARALTIVMDQDFSKQLRTDTTPLLKTYDALQKSVVLLKVDVLLALNIRVDYLDADGD